MTACSSAQSSAPAWEGRAWDSAGIEIVHNYGTPLWEETEGWNLSETLRIGVADGEPEYMFGKISDLGMLSDGRIVVADGIAQHLRYFRPDGGWEKTVGQAGSGPGEFGNLGLTILVGPADTMLVLDVRNQRANRFGPDGTWLGSWLAYQPEAWTERAWDYSSTGRIVSHMYQAPQVVGDGSDSLDFVVVRDLAGSAGDTVGFVLTGLETQVSEGRMEYYFFAGSPEIGLCPDNSLLTARQDRYEISRYSPSGNLEQIVRLDRENILVSASDRTNFREWYKDIWLESGYVTPSRVEELLSAFHFNQTYPPFRTLTCGPKGSIWVQPWKPVSALTQDDLPDLMAGIPVDASERFDLFNRQGEYLGVVSLPSGFFPDRFRGDHLIGRWRDSLGLESVGVLRVEGIED
jgi:hypothetical protein